MMSAASSELLRIALPYGPLAPGHARDALQHLDRIEPVREDAVLLVSELVSTAVIATDGHGHEQSLELIASETPDGVQLTVDGVGERPEPKAAPLVARVIDSLARRWGIESRDGRARVWAELSL